MAEKELRSIQFPGLEDRYVVPEGGGGATGPAGKDGLTPTIGANGNWYLGDEDTGKPSRGEKGDPGAKGADGAAGKDGSDGYSPEATVTPINGGAKIIIKDRNGTTSANVMNGAQGPKGAAGPQGDVGPKGDSYTLTTADKSEIAEAVVAGGVQAEFGDEPVSLGITGAHVGQISKITAVDATGKPTKWEPVEMASGGKAWTKIIDVEITEATMLFEATGLDNVTELYCEWAGLKTASETAKRSLDLYINDIHVGSSWVLNQPRNGQYMLGYSSSKYNGLVWYNVKSPGIAGSNNTFNADMGATARISYMLAHDVGAATKVKIKALNADNAPVTGQIKVWAR